MAAAAGTRRTTPRKVTSISDFEAERKKIVKARKGTKTFEWDVYDRTWHLKRPNIAFIAEQEESETIGSYSVRYGTASNTSVSGAQAIPANWKVILDHYRVPK